MDRDTKVGVALLIAILVIVAFAGYVIGERAGYKHLSDECMTIAV